MNRRRGYLAAKSWFVELKQPEELPLLNSVILEREINHTLGRIEHCHTTNNKDPGFHTSAKRVYSSESFLAWHSRGSLPVDWK